MFTAPLRIFLASFLVLFLEVALIRWLPAQIRLLSYFSNFILLAAFLGIGIGALLGRMRGRSSCGIRCCSSRVVAAVYFFRLEVRINAPGSIYFTSGTSDPVTAVETTLLLPVLFVGVAALFAALAQRMAQRDDRAAAASRLHDQPRRQPRRRRGLRARLVARGAAEHLVRRRVRGGRPAARATGGGPPPRLAAHPLPGGLRRARVPTWSAARSGRRTTRSRSKQQGRETVVEVNNIWHQSMAPVGLQGVLLPVAVHGVRRHVQGRADPRRRVGHRRRGRAQARRAPASTRSRSTRPSSASGGEAIPDRPYSDPRVHPVADDARHFLRTTEKKYDLVVFALIDSLTLQSAFSGVRLESYMFTEESFRAVRDVLKPDGVLVVYNYFREPWLVDRLANTAAAAFGEEPMVHVHPAKDQLGVMVVGPRLQDARDLSRCRRPR